MPTHNPEVDPSGVRPGAAFQTSPNMIIVSESNATGTHRVINTGISQQFSGTQ